MEGGAGAGAERRPQAQAQPPRHRPPAHVRRAAAAAFRGRQEGSHQEQDWRREAGRRKGEERGANAPPPSSGAAQPADFEVVAQELPGEAPQAPRADPPAPALPLEGEDEDMQAEASLASRLASKIAAEPARFDSESDSEGPSGEDSEERAAAAMAEDGGAGALAPDPGDGVSFEDLGVASDLAEHLEDCNFQAPTDVQRRTIPALLKGRDALVKSPTGSGKTLAFAVPIVQSLHEGRPKLRREDGTRAIVITPTRELATQIEEVVQLLLGRKGYHHVVPGSLMGGESRKREKARLRKGINVLVATPGRLLDHLQKTEAFRCEDLQTLVLDEADRLLDLGFEKQVKEIIGILDGRSEAGDRSTSRQTVLLSATMHAGLGRIAVGMKAPVTIGFSCELVEGNLRILDGDQHAEAGSGGKSGGAAVAEGSAGRPQELPLEVPAGISQFFVECAGKERLETLLLILRDQFRGAVKAQASPCKLVLFLSTCDGVEYMHLLLKFFSEDREEPLAFGGGLYKLHGNMTQTERAESFKLFNKASSALLVCTDVAARGLDFPLVTGILQYDPPGPLEDYVHRVGRTARGGRCGTAYLFLQPSELEYLGLLEKRGVQLKRCRRYGVADPGERGSGGWGGGRNLGGRMAMHHRAQSILGGSEALRESAASAFRAYVRAYAAQPAALKSVFYVKKLHLGRLAHSFGLKERPTVLGHSASKAALKKRKYYEAKKAMNPKRQKFLLTTE